LTLALSLYGATATKLISSSAVEAPEELGNSSGWSEFSSSFLLGGAGGAAFAYFLNYLEPMQKFGGLLWS
jgi:hypothetical protein